MGLEIEFEVTTHPEFTTEQLAVQLAESLQGSFDAQRDISAFNEQVNLENNKVSELEGLLYKVEEFHRNPPAKISRMEPLATYDPVALREQINLARKRKHEWEELIVQATDKVSRLQKRTLELQKEIKERNT